MQLVDDGLCPGPSGPAVVAPRIMRRIDHQRGTVHVALLTARGRVRHRKAVRQNELVFRSRLDTGRQDLEPAIVRRHGRVGAVETQRERLDAGSPDPETDLAGPDELRAPGLRKA